MTARHTHRHAAALLRTALRATTDPQLATSLADRVAATGDDTLIWHAARTTAPVRPTATGALLSVAHAGALRWALDAGAPLADVIRRVDDVVVDELDARQSRPTPGERVLWEAVAEIAVGDDDAVAAVVDMAALFDEMYADAAVGDLAERLPVLSAWAARRMIERAIGQGRGDTAAAFLRPFPDATARALVDLATEKPAVAARALSTVAPVHDPYILLSHRADPLAPAPDYDSDASDALRRLVRSDHTDQRAASAVAAWWALLYGARASDEEIDDTQRQLARRLIGEDTAAAWVRLPPSASRGDVVAVGLIDGLASASDATASGDRLVGALRRSLARDPERHWGEVSAAAVADGTPTPMVLSAATVDETIAAARRGEPPDHWAEGLRAAAQSGLLDPNTLAELGARHNAAGMGTMAPVWAMRLGADPALVNPSTLADVLETWERDHTGPRRRVGGRIAELLASAPLADMAPLVDGWAGTLGELADTASSVASTASPR